MSEDYFNNNRGGRDGYTPGEGNNSVGGHAPRQRISRGARPAGSSNYSAQRGSQGGYNANNGGSYRKSFF